MRQPHEKYGRLAQRGSGPQERSVPSADGITGWFAGRLPDDWFEGAPTVTVDRDEVLVVGRVPAPDTGGQTADSGSAADTADADRAEAEQGRITRFREQTREARIAIAREAEHRYGRKVAWGAESGASRQVFTTLSVPVMTRLRQSERQVLDTLVDSGVARSRSEALVWSVRLVGSNAESWLAELRGAMEAVQQVREQGPTAS